MGTKNKPAAFDCYANAEPDEPMFVLLARDAVAPEVIEHWVSLREAMPGQLAEARTSATNMRLWRAVHR